MRVHFVGNLQAGRLQAMFQRSHPASRATYSHAGGDRPAPEPASLAPMVEAADIVVLQASSQRRAGPAAEEVRAMTAGEVIVLPEILIDGMAGLEREGPGDAAILHGLDALASAAAATGLDRPTLLRRYLAGEIDLDQARRLDQSLRRLERVEEDCDIRISDTIRALLREVPVLHGMASPTQAVLYPLFGRLCDYLGLDPDPGMASDIVFDASLTLPRGTRAFTPWDVQALGLAYGPDPHWHSAATALLQRAWRMIEEDQGLPTPRRAVAG